jgi:dienelactone hydrolase
MSRLIGLVLLGLSLSVARAEITTKPIAYQQAGITLEGVLAYDTALNGRHPAVLIAHENGATSNNARARALQVARLGYVAFSIDLFGKGQAPKNSDEAADKLNITKNRSLVRDRTAAGLAALLKQPQVDEKRVAAVGYGYGGTALLELARSKGALEGVVCVHGDLSALGDDAKNIAASILVILGADDPLIPTSQLTAFEEEMKKGGVDWQVLRFGGVAHDFTNPLAGRDLKTGRAYDSDADKRTVEAIKSFLADTFPPTSSPPSIPSTPKKTPPVKSPTSAPVAKDIPEKVLKVLKHVDETGEAIDGYEGGRSFGNFEKRLPQNDARGRRIRYREWDVNPLQRGKNRGAERLVTGSDGSAHYTDDHYDSFKKIRGGSAK